MHKTSVFNLWVLVSPKAAAELPGFAEEVRELNLFTQYAVFHDEGEVAAKIFVPSRQIQSVEKYDRTLKSLRKDTRCAAGAQPHAASRRSAGC
jgi:hypothetical protein